MTSPEINVKFFEHEDNPLPEDGSVHVITTTDGMDLRLGLWPVPGFKISIVDSPGGSSPGAETPPATGNNPIQGLPVTSSAEPDPDASAPGDGAGAEPADGENPLPEAAAARDTDRRAGEKPAIGGDAGTESLEQSAPDGALSDKSGKAAVPSIPDLENSTVAATTGTGHAAQETDGAIDNGPDEAREKETRQDQTGEHADPAVPRAAKDAAPVSADGTEATGVEATGVEAVSDPSSDAGRVDDGGTDDASGEDDGEAKATVQPDSGDEKPIAAASREPVISADHGEVVDEGPVAATGSSGGQSPETDSKAEPSHAGGKDDTIDAPTTDTQSTSTEANETPTGEPDAPSSVQTPQPAGPLEEAVTMSGTIIVLNGRSEFIEKYAEVIRELIDRGFCVAALDWRGQGGSERLIKRRPLKGHIDDMDSYVEDLTTLLDFLETTNCPKPYYCLAHSTGGQILLRAAPLVSSRISRAVTTAPFLDLASYRTPKPLVYAFASTLTYSGLGEMYAPGAGRNPPSDDPFEGNAYSSDQRRYQRTADLVHRHKELAIGGPTVSWMYAALKSAEELFDPDFLSSITLPVLMLSASDDKVVSVQAVEDFASMARTVSHLSIPGARHEILMERDEIRSQFWAAFDAFIPGED